MATTMLNSPYSATNLYGLTDEQLQLQEMVREFAKREVAPIAAEIDENERFAKETFDKLGKLGLMGVPVPEEYGGAGADTLSYVLAVEELAKVCGSTGLSYAAHISLGSMPLVYFGTEAQKKTWLPYVTSGEYMGSWALTEPQAGSDSARQQTTAVRDGDHFVLNGAKNFITNATHAKYVIVMAMTDKSKGNKGISSFIVPTDTPGFAIDKHERKMGMRGSPTTALSFQNVRIPAELMISEEGTGFKQAMKTLDGGRISIAALALGIATGAYEAALAYAKERVAFGQPIGKFQMVQAMLADAATELHAARMMVYHAARLKDAGLPHTLEGAQAKLYTSEVSNRVTNNAVQILGGYGYTKDFPVERMLRDSKLCEIGEGTSQIQRIVIARNIGL